MIRRGDAPIAVSAALALLLSASAAAAASPTAFLKHFRIGMSAQEAAAAMPGCAATPAEALPVGCDKATGRCPSGARIWCPFAAEEGEKEPVAPGVELLAESGPRGLTLAMLEFKGSPAEVFAKLEGVAGKLARKYGKWREAGASAYTDTDEKGRYYRWMLWDLSILAEARRVEGRPDAPARGRVVFVKKGVDFPGWGGEIVAPSPASAAPTPP